MHRRRFLAAAGAAGGLSLAGCLDWNQQPNPPKRRNWTTPRIPTGTPAASRWRPAELAAAWGFGNVVNLESAGADATGQRTVDEVFANHADDDTLVFLPEGRYRFESSVAIGGGATFGLVGSDATIVAPEGYDQTLLGLGAPDALSELLVDGLTFDFTGPNAGGRPLFARASDRVVVRDVTVNGQADTDKDLLRVDVTDPEGSGLVHRYVAADGAAADTKVTGCEVGGDNRGDVSFVDCHIAGFPDNGLYARPPQGRISVLGGIYENNGISGVRIQASGESLVRGVHVRCDRSVGDNMRGIRLKSGRNVRVENCLVELLDVDSSDGAVTFASELESATLQNTRLRVDADGVNAVRIKSPNSDVKSTKSGPFRCEDVTITGSAAGGEAVRMADRDGCEFDNVRIVQSGANRDGIVVRNVRGHLRDVSISVTGRPLTIHNSRMSQSNVTLTPP